MMRDFAAVKDLSTFAKLRRLLLLINRSLKCRDPEIAGRDRSPHAAVAHSQIAKAVHSGL
jgi:hypothetical protein